MDIAEFRRILGHWVSGVGIVTARTNEVKVCGLTANAVASVSLQPPLVLVCIDQTADSHNCVRQAGDFALNIMATDQERIARRFSAWEVDKKFEGIAYQSELTGAPVLHDALAWVDCRIWAEYAGG